jgi:hypothetical protein
LKDLDYVELKQFSEDEEAFKDWLSEIEVVKCKEKITHELSRSNAAVAEESQLMEPKIVELREAISERAKEIEVRI